MQVPPVSLKSVEILRLQLTMQDETETLLDEIDALLFSLEAASSNALQIKALDVRVHTLSQIGWLLPQRKAFDKQAEALKHSIMRWRQVPHEDRFARIYHELARLKSILKVPACSSDKIFSSKPTEALLSFDQSSQATLRYDTSHEGSLPLKKELPASLSPLRSALAPKTSLPTAQESLQEEFKTTYDSMHDLLKNLLDTVIPSEKPLHRLHELLNHTKILFSDLTLALEGKVPAPRPPLERLACLLFQASGHSFAIPQRNILKILRQGSPDETMPIGSPLTFDEKNFPRISLTEALHLQRYDAVQDHARIIVTSASGTFVLETDGPTELRSLLPDQNLHLIRSLGPYHGVALSPLQDSPPDKDLTIILDPDRLAEKVHTAFFPVRNLPLSELPHAHPADLPKYDVHLIATTLHDKKIAVPLNQISRIERVTPRDLVEHGQKKLLRKNEQLLPAYDADCLISPHIHINQEYPASLMAILTEEMDGTRALLVREILDHDTPLTVTDFGFHQKPGILGTALYPDLIACVLDLGTLPR